MKKLLLLSALVLTSAFIAAPRASAQSAQFTFTPMSFTAAPGSDITFRIDLTFAPGGNIEDLNGLTFFLQQTNGTTPFFTITGRDNTGSLFTDLQTSNFQLLPDALDKTNPSFSNQKDLGALLEVAPLGSGTFFVTNITLSIAANATPGTFTISSVTTGGKTAVINDSQGDTFPIQPGSISVTIIPEPSTYALLAMTGMGLAVVAYRRRAVA